MVGSAEVRLGKRRMVCDKDAEDVLVACRVTISADLEREQYFGLRDELPAAKLANF